tara:strand:+ start:26 stop:862 length:837 start_codon:yes stop_codon:yes gene_type:complete
MQKAKVLLFGFGRMGKIHQKYLEEISVDYSVVDPLINVVDEKFKNDFDLHQLGSFTHVIISTPDETHFEIYKNIRSVNKEIKILIEKPAVLDIEHLNELSSDLNLSVGLVERFNSTIIELKQILGYDKTHYIEFKRCSLISDSNQTVSSFRDVGIHDLDLFDYLIGIEDKDTFTINNVSNTYFANLTKQNDITASFLWSNEFYKKERSILVVQKSRTLYVDLLNYKISIFSKNDDEMYQELVVESRSSIKSELENFLQNKNYILGIQAHKLLIKNLNQ